MENMTGLLFSKKKCLGIWSEGVQRGFLSERKGKIIPYRGAANRKSAGTSKGKSSSKNLEAESIRSRAEATGGCVKGEDSHGGKMRDNAHGTFIAECLSNKQQQQLAWAGPLVRPGRGTFFSSFFPLSLVSTVAPHTAYLGLGTGGGGYLWVARPSAPTRKDRRDRQPSPEQPLPFCFLFQR